MSLRVMTWNIQYCQSGSRIDDIAAFIRQNTPDIVLLQEIAISGALAGGLDQPAELAARTGLPFSTFARDGSFGGGEVGNAVLSRFPLDGTELILLPNNSDSSILKTQAVINSVVHHIYTTHPRGVIAPGNTKKNTDLAVDVLVAGVLNLNPDHAVIVGGDLNEAPVDRLADDAHLTDTPADLDDR